MGGPVRRHNESAGKRKGARLRKGAPWLKTMLVQCAWAAKRAKNSYYRALFFRLQARRGPQKAICAVAASSRCAQQAFGEETVLRLDPRQDEEISPAYRLDILLQLLAVEARLHGEKARGEVGLKADEQ